MKRMIYLLCLLVAASASAQDRQTVQEGYYLGDVFMHESGTLLLAEAHREDYVSTLHLMNGAEADRQWPLDLRINTVRYIDSSPPKIVVAGSNGTSRSTRIYRLDRGTELVEEWRSKNLSYELQEAEIGVSTDGRLWSATVFGSQEARIVVGSTADPSYDPSWEWALEIPAIQGADDMVSSSTILNSDPENPSVGVVYKGSVFVLDKEEPAARQLLPHPGLDAQGLYYQQEAGILWVSGSFSRFSGFRLADLKQGGDATAPLAPALEINPKALGLPPTLVDMTGLADGQLVLQGQAKDAGFLYYVEVGPADAVRARSALRLENRSLLAGAGVVEIFPLDASAQGAAPLTFRAQILDIDAMFEEISGSDEDRLEHALQAKPGHEVVPGFGER